MDQTRWLKIVKGPQAGRRFALKGQIVIGRGMDADIQIDDEGVSRHHACIAVGDDGSSVLFDLNSTNGTMVGDQSIEKRVLASGDEFSIGKAVFNYREGGPHEVVTDEHELQPSDTIEISVEEMEQNMAPPPTPRDGPLDRMATVAHINSMVRTLKDLADEKHMGDDVGCGSTLHEIAVAAEWQFCPACGAQIKRS